MSKTAMDHARSLWSKASHDLIAARATIATGEALDTVCFHAQQAVEKSLKAILALHDVEPPKTHHLNLLVELAKAVVPHWMFDDERISKLTPFAVIVRYEDLDDPTPAEAKAALETAEDVHLQVKSLIEAGSQ